MMALAIVMHSNLFHNHVWTGAYPNDPTQRFNTAMKTSSYLIDHQVASGLSIGVFDTEYKYRTKEAEAVGGKCLFNLDDPTTPGDKLLEQMDFPLVSVAMAYDGIDPLDHEKLGPIMEVIPIFADVYANLDKNDPREPESWKARQRGEVLMRNATSTRHEYEGQGIMGKLARFMMRDAKARGYKNINIECLSDAVTHVWSNPKMVGIEGKVVSSFWTQEILRTDEHGNQSRLFGPAEQLVTRVDTRLR